MSLYYMRDNHTFLPLPDADVDAAIEAIHHAYVIRGYSHGMLCTKRSDAPPHVHGLGRDRWAEFEVLARKWLTAMLQRYKSPADLEYESWCARGVRVPVVVDGRTEEQWCQEACRIGAYDCVEVIEGVKGRWIRTFTGERTPEKIEQSIRALKAQAERYDRTSGVGGTDGS